MYQIGKIVNTHGIKGEARVFNLSDFNRFAIGKTVYVDYKSEMIPLKITQVRPHKNILIIKFSGIDDINDVLMYKECFLYAKDKVKQLDEDDYYYDELINKRVETEDGKIMGHVVSIVEVPQGHLLEIESDAFNKTKLIPFRKEFVLAIDDEKIIIQYMEGLL